MLLVALLGAACLLTASCEEDSATQPPSAEPFPLPLTKEALLDSFRTAYQNRDIEGYGSLLHPDFKFITPGTGFLFKLPYQVFDREMDLACMTNIFSGEPYVAADGTREGAVTDITFTLLEQLTLWEPSAHPDFPSAQRALFEIEISLGRLADSKLHVAGMTELYAVQQDSLHNGVHEDYWRLRGQIDHTESGGKPVEPVTWSILKSMYR